MGSSQSLRQWTQECPKGQSCVHCCSYFILMTCPMSLILKFGCLRMIASCIGPYVPWRTRSCSSRTCLPWSAGAIHGACALTRLNAHIPCPQPHNSLLLTVRSSAIEGWYCQISGSGVCSKTNSTLGFLRRNLRKCPSSLKETAYISLAHSTLEYAATIWDPHLSSDISSIEKIQRRAACFVKGDYNTFTSVTNILNELGWQRLEDRRRDLRLALMHKIVHGLVAVPVDSLNLEPKDKRTRANHRYTYKHLSPKTDPVKFFFTNRTIPAWNDLSASAVEAPSLESFEAKLAACRRPSPEGLERAPAPQPIRLYTLRRELRIIYPDHECMIV